MNIKWFTVAGFVILLAAVVIAFVIAFTGAAVIWSVVPIVLALAAGVLVGVDK